MSKPVTDLQKRIDALAIQAARLENQIGDLEEQMVKEVMVEVWGAARDPRKFWLSGPDTCSDPRNLHARCICAESSRAAKGYKKNQCIACRKVHRSW